MRVAVLWLTDWRVNERMIVRIALVLWFVVYLLGSRFRWVGMGMW